MPTSAFFLLAGIGAGLAFLVWNASTMRTDPEGYTEIAAVSAFEIDDAVATLRGRGILTYADDHLTRGLWWGGSRTRGVVRLLVPLDRADEAVRLLRAHPPNAKGLAPPA